jgi:polysaccharide pyruvyl transferase WcaK-like protein
MIITLVGWNCKKNLGDDVMTDVIIDNFSKTYPKAHFKIIGEQSSLPVFQASLNHPGITIKAIKHYDFFNSIKGFKFFFNRFFIAPLIALNSDIVIIGGGTIYHSVALTKFYEFVLGVKKIFNPKCKVYSTGVSIGPFKTHEELEVFTEFSSKVDFFSVRDKRSKDLLNNNQRSILAPD